MSTVPVLNWKKEKVGEVGLPEEIFDYPYRRHLVWEVVKAHLAGLRRGTHKTKVRSEVSGSGKKPFKQKGTGRARQGGSRPPIHRHGGTAHGPVPRSYAQGVSVNEKKNALKAVLSQRVREQRLVVVDRMDLQSHRTKDLQGAVGGLGIEGKALFVDSRENENLARASRNVKDWKLVDALKINAYEVMKHGTVVLSQRALTRVVETLGGQVMEPQEVIRRPLITEKATRLKEASGTICFEVARNANKIQIARAVTALFGVKVADVQVANRKGKWKRMGRFLGQRKDWKKAYVRLAPGEKPIEFFEGV